MNASVSFAVKQPSYSSLNDTKRGRLGGGLDSVVRAVC